MSVSYTTGNWAVTSSYTDTIATAKNFSVPDLSYGTDFAKVEDEPAEAKIRNKTGSVMIPCENIRYGTSQVADVYNGSEGLSASKLPSSKGVQTLVEISENYKAVNSVTGLEYDIPCKGRIVLRFPTASCVNSTLVTDLMKRTIAAALNTGGTDVNRELEIAKGALLPSNL